MDIEEIKRYLPHRYPLLLLDRVVEFEADTRIVAIKNVTVNEPFFQGHFPHYAVMPGVLIIEAMAQAACFLSLRSSGQENDGSSVYYFVGIDGARFKKPVVPGDQLHLEVALLGSKRGLFKYSGVAKVDGQVVSEAELMCTQRRLDNKPEGQAA
ncbi:MAG: 3-hydroxyacyl-ACP dehydratase FabZ [Betaproteobacteria bacterium]|nr:3-hydroxyacyl-ACP dehydratase FabZ [Betaproteobacteria bacterium]